MSGSVKINYRFHATVVEPRLHDGKDMAGGIEPIPAEQPIEVAPGFETPDGGEPTEEEKHKLRKIADKLPWSAFLVCVIELCERFTYYGLSGPFQNYIENAYGDKSLPGAIGLGQTGATGKPPLTSFPLLPLGPKGYRAFLLIYGP